MVKSHIHSFSGYVGLSICGSKCIEPGRLNTSRLWWQLHKLLTQHLSTAAGNTPTIPAESDWLDWYHNQDTRSQSLKLEVDLLVTAWSFRVQGGAS